jgi:hypothetical protein
MGPRGTCSARRAHPVVTSGCLRDTRPGGCGGLTSIGSRVSTEAEQWQGVRGVSRAASRHDLPRSRTHVIFVGARGEGVPRGHVRHAPHLKPPASTPRGEGPRSAGQTDDTRPRPLNGATRSRLADARVRSVGRDRQPHRTRTRPTHTGPLKGRRHRRFGNTLTGQYVWREILCHSRRRTLGRSKKGPHFLRA